MIDLEACRLIIKGFKTREEVYEYADKIQKLGLRGSVSLNIKKSVFI